MSVYPRKMDNFATNGVIRRMHGTQEWSSLHCIRTGIQHYLASSCQILPQQQQQHFDQVTYVTRLKETMMQLPATPTHHHTRQKPFVSSDLSHCILVFIWQDAVRHTLEQPCYGPHKVVKRRAKTFTVDVNDKPWLISLNRLKPAHIEDSAMIDVTATDNTLLPPSPAVPTPPPTMRTIQSGQHVH